MIVVIVIVVVIVMEKIKNAPFLYVSITRYRQHVFAFIGMSLLTPWLETYFI